MGNYQKPNVEYFIRKQRPAIRKETLMKRTNVILGTTVTVDFSDKTKTLRPYVKSLSITRVTPLNGCQNLLNFKAAQYLRSRDGRLGAMVRRSQPEIKVGTVSSTSVTGRVAQGIGSVVTPGNTSKLRNPIRSGLFGALTPGGGSGLRRLLPKPTRGYRCNPGFEFGGRFTNQQHSTCGAQLFEIPGPLALIARGIRRLNNAPTPPTATAQSLSQVVEGNPTGARAVQIQRMAQIPRTGAFNQNSLGKSVSDSIIVLTGAPAGEGRMIRRDGVILRPLVPSSVLREFSGNKDMEDGVMILAVHTPKDISSDSLALLSGAAMSRISFVAPNGTLLTIERARPLTVGERRKFGRMLNQVVGSSDQYDVGNNIRDFANNSGGAFKYTELFPNVEKPNDLVDVVGDNGVKRQVRRWVKETFIDKGKPITKPIAKPESESEDTPIAPNVSESDDIDIMDMDAEKLIDALKEASFTSEKVSGGTRWTDGERTYFQMDETLSNGSIARHVYSTVGEEIGLDTQRVVLLGDEKTRSSLIDDIGNISARDQGTKPDGRDVLRIAMLDYLLDKTKRNEVTMQANPNGGTSVIPTGNELSAGAGLDKAELEARSNLDIPTFFENDASPYANSFRDMSQSERKLVTSLYDDLLERVQKFNWSDYIDRLSVSGNLSAQEQLHLALIKTLYEIRLSNLVKSKKVFITSMGI